jgi:hypothetical protein
VDLVDDQGLDCRRGFASLRREQEEHGLRSGDEDAGRLLGEPPPILWRSVPVRVTTVTSGPGAPSPAACGRIRTRGDRWFRSMSTASAF